MSLQPSSASSPTYTAHATVAAVSGSAVGAAIIIILHYYMGDMPPAAEVVAETTVANAGLGLIASFLMKMFGLLSN